MKTRLQITAILLFLISLLMSSCESGESVGPAFTSTPTLKPTATFTPEFTPAPALQTRASVSNERWEILVDDVYVETELTSDLITETRTYTAEEGFVFVVVRARIRTSDQSIWEEMMGKDLLPMASLLNESGTTFSATGSSKEKGQGCVGDCQFLLFNSGSSSEYYEFEAGFIFTLKKGDVFGKTLRFQFQDSSFIPLAVVME